MNEAVVEHASTKQLIPQILEMDPGDDLYDDAKVKILVCKAHQRLKLMVCHERWPHVMEAADVVAAPFQREAPP